MKQSVYNAGALISRDDGVVALVRKFVAQLEENGEKVPGYHNRPFLRIIAERCGLRFDRLKLNARARQELDKASVQLGLAPYTGTKYQELKTKITDYAERKRQTGETIPSDPRRPSRASHVGVAYEMGVDYREWSRSACISKFATERLQGLPLGDPFEPPAEAQGIFRDSYYDRLADFRAFLQRYEATNTPIPESLARAGYPNYVIIQADYAHYSTYKISRNRLTLDTEFRRSLLETITKVGLQPKLNRVALRITWKELLDFAAVTRRRETKGTPTSEQSVKNLVSAGNQLMRHLGRADSDCCDVDLATDLDTNLDAMTAMKSNKATAKKVSAEIRSLAQLRLQLLRRVELPNTFPKAVRELCARGGVTYAFVEHRLRLPKGTVGRWAYDLSMPSPSSLDHVGKLEAFFQLPVGSLTDLLPRIFGRRKKAGTGSSLSECHGSHLVRHLPLDFDQRSPEEQEAIVRQVRKSLGAQDRPYSAKHGALTKDRYALKLAKWPSQAVVEWNELKDFKESELPQLDKERTLDAIWTNETTQACLGRLEKFFGFVTLPKNRGGLALPVDTVSLGLLVSYQLVHRYVDWCRIRRGNKLNTADFKFLYFVTSLLREKYGPIYQSPDLAFRLRPHDGLLKPEFIEAAQANWHQTCVSTESRLRNLAKQIETRSVRTRDPFEPVAGLLECQHPRAEYKRLILAMARDLPDLTTSPVFHHVHIRNCLMMWLTWLLAFRSKNIRQMTYRPDNKGHLRQENGQWVVTVPWTEFKNKNSEFFGPKGDKRDYHKVLPDKNGLYALIETYVTLTRPFLMNGKDHEFLLLSLGGEPLSKDVFSITFRNVTACYFAYNPYTGTGMPGVMPHGPHAVRHVTATDVVKNTGRFDLAAYAIQDTEQQARKTYTRFLVADKHRLASEYLDLDCSPEMIGGSGSGSTTTRATLRSNTNYDKLLIENRELQARIKALEAQQAYGKRRAA